MFHASIETMIQTRFYPVGNGDCSQIVLADNRRLLFDYCHRRKAEDKDDPQIDLDAALSVELAAAGRGR